AHAARIVKCTQGAPLTAAGRCGPQAIALEPIRARPGSIFLHLALGLLDAGYRIFRDHSHPLHEWPVTMSAPFSTSSLANSLNLRISTPAARNAVLGIEGIGAASDSFSRTLQNQMNAGGNASTRNESAPSPATREPERARAPEPTREPERSAADSAGKNTQTDRTDQQGAAQGRSGEPRSGETAASGQKGDTANG